MRHLTSDIQVGHLILTQDGAVAEVTATVDGWSNHVWARSYPGAQPRAIPTHTIDAVGYPNGSLTNRNPAWFAITHTPRQVSLRETAPA